MGFTESLGTLRPVDAMVQTVVTHSSTQAVVAHSFRIKCDVSRKVVNETISLS